MTEFRKKTTNNIRLKPRRSCRGGLPWPPLGGQIALAILTWLLTTILTLPYARAQSSLPPQTIQTRAFTLTYDSKGVTGISNPNDPYGAEFLAPNRRLGDPIVKYKTLDTQWSDLAVSERKLDANPKDGVLVYSDYAENSPLKMVQTFQTSGESLEWKSEVETTTAAAVQIGDLAIPIPWRVPAGESPDAIFEKSFTKHHFYLGLLLVSLLREAERRASVSSHNCAAWHQARVLCGRGKGQLSSFHSLGLHRKPGNARDVAARSHLSEFGTERKQ
jgi:hypothetical protein